MWGVDPIHLVWVGGGIKKPGVNLSGNKHFSDHYSCSEESRTKAQRLGEIMGEGNK